MGLDLAAAGAKEADDEEAIDIGGEEEVDEDSIDGDEE
jgi:DNA gyrase subunit A